MSLPLPPQHLDAVPPLDPDELEAELACSLAIEMEREQNAAPAPDLAPAEVPGRYTAIVYIDADNQSPQLASSLMATLIEDLFVDTTLVTIAGNNAGKQVDCWRSHLRDINPSLCIETLTVRARKEAADIALILALGARLEQHIHEQQLIIVLSRDDLLIGAAEQARARGARVLLAYADSSIPTAVNVGLSTLLLPAPGKSQPKPKPRQPTASPVPSKPAPSKPATKISTEVPVVDKDSVPSVLAALRKMCPEHPGGGYSSTHVGQSLYQLGFDLKARRAFLKTVPNLATRGSGTNKVLLF